MTTPATGAEPAADDAATKLRLLAQLRDSGVITEADFQAKKDDLLTQIQRARGPRLTPFPVSAADQARGA